MADWASALAQGVSAAANTGAGIMGDQIKMDQQLQAEQAASDIKLDLHTRMAAADEMMKNRAAENFSSYVKKFADEEIPVEPQTVPQTGITRASADVVGTGPGFAGSAQELAATLKKYQAASQDPNLTDEQRADAQGVVDQISKQVFAQQQMNEDAADGKTRKRTPDEVNEAAKSYALQNDAPAFIAGTAMLAPGDRQDAIDKANALKEKDITRKDAQAVADRESREKIASNRDDQREKAADQRFEAMMAKLGPDGKGSGGSKSATVQTLEFLRDELGWSKSEIGAYLTQSKHASVEDIYLKLKTANDKNFGEASDDELMQKAQSIATMSRGSGAAPAASSTPSASKTLNWDPKTGTFK